MRCQVHPAFDDVQGWFLEVRAGDSELLAALHRSLTSKYHLIFGEDPHGGCVKDNGAALAAIWLQSLEMELQEGDVLVNPAAGFVAKRDLIILAEIALWRPARLWACSSPSTKRGTKTPWPTIGDGETTHRQGWPTAFAQISQSQRDGGTGKGVGDCNELTAASPNRLNPKSPGARWRLDASDWTPAPSVN